MVSRTCVPLRSAGYANSLIFRPVGSTTPRCVVLAYRSRVCPDSRLEVLTAVRLTTGRLYLQVTIDILDDSQRQNEQVSGKTVMGNVVVGTFC
jgi:hypothetical protein